MEKIHIRNIFRVFIPLERSLGSGTAQTKTEPFGLEYSQNDSRFEFSFKLVCTDEYGNIKHEPKDCFTWAKRNPIVFQQKSKDDAPNGLYVRLKINQGVFDFRKTKDRLFQIIVELTENGSCNRTGTSVIWELFPKKRQTEIAESENEAVLPIYWLGEDGYLIDNQHASPSGSSHSVQESSFEDITNNNAMHASNNNQQYALTLHNPANAMALYDSTEYESPNDNYMVLYNGNAEVVGNFRALNFYKASDINIKEDIRLLEEDRDCRAALLRINGVEYKFKPGVSHSTNKRFTGYIAQQVETVVPEAVQLIDGILHVDYESLIPYLSESVKQNFRDLQSVTAEVQNLRKVLDGLYEEFTSFKRPKKSEDKKTKQNNRRNKVIGWIVGLVTVSAIIAMTITWIYFSDVPHVKLIPLGDTLKPQQIERDFLAEFYKNLTVNQQPLKAWNLTESHCTWHGISCNATTGRVTSVDMSMLGSWFGSTNGNHIPEEIGIFTELEHLDLSFNFLMGTIPDSIKNLTKLKSLALAQNSLYGTIPDLRGLKKLNFLAVNNNGFSGPLDMLMQLPSISTLWFYGNYASELPRNISTSLTHILMASCGFNGTIPNEWTDSNLHVIDLSSNSLHGSVPCFGAQLQQLDLSHNMLNGTFCGSKLRSATDLSLENNNLTGVFDLPHVNISNFHLVSIAHNSFTTLMPSTVNETIILKTPGSCSAGNNPFKCPIPQWTAKSCGATCN